MDGSGFITKLLSGQGTVCFFTQLKMIKIHFWGSHYLRGSKNSIVSYLVLQGVFLMCSFHNEISACWDNFLGLKLSFALFL